MQNFIETTEANVLRAFLVSYFKSDEYFDSLCKCLPKDADIKLAIEVAISIMEGFPLEETKRIGSAGSSEEARKIRHGLIVDREKPPEAAPEKRRVRFMEKYREKKLKDIIIKNDLSEEQLQELKLALSDGLDYQTVFEMGKRKVSAGRMKQIREIFLVRRELQEKKKEEKQNG